METNGAQAGGQGKRGDCWGLITRKRSLGPRPSVSPAHLSLSPALLKPWEGSSPAPGETEAQGPCSQLFLSSLCLGSQTPQLPRCHRLAARLGSSPARHPTYRSASPTSPPQPGSHCLIPEHLTIWLQPSSAPQSCCHLGWPVPTSLFKKHIYALQLLYPPIVRFFRPGRGRLTSCPLGVSS